MRIVLLLLVALAGPFCTFIQASTLVVPTVAGVTPEPVILSETTAVIAKTEESAPQEATSTPVPVSEATEAAASTEKAPSVSTEAQVIQSEIPIETAAPTDAAKSTVLPAEVATTEAVVKESIAKPKEIEKPESESQDGVEIEGEEGMGTGQLVGIVIGALVGVIVVIAVIILVVRRMGQYSP